MFELKVKLHWVIVAVAVALTFFTYDAAYNIGRLIAVTLFFFFFAWYLSKNKSPESINKYLSIAAIAPLIIVIHTIYSENTQKQLLSEISQTVSDTIKLQSDNASNEPSIFSNSDISQLKLKPARDNEELLRQVNSLAKIANSLTKKNYEEQKRVLTDAKFEEYLTPRSLKNQAGLDKLSDSIKLYEQFLNRIELENNKFNDDYRKAVKIVGGAHKEFMIGFNDSFEKSTQEQSVNLRIQRDLLREFQKIVTLLQIGYKNRQIKYDSAQDKFIMLDDIQLKQYNQIGIRIQELAKEEEALLQAMNARLRGYQSDLDKVIRR